MRRAPERVLSDLARDLLRAYGAAVPVRGETLVVEVDAEEAEFPELVGNVFAGVGDGAVGAHENLVWFLEAREPLGLRELQDPTAGMAALGLQRDRPGFSEHFEGPPPEILAEDVAFPGHQVVSDADAPHRGQMSGGDRIGHRGGDSRRLVVPRFHRVQDLAPPGARLGSGFIGAADLRVQIPAEVGKPLGVSRPARKRGVRDDGAKLLLRIDAG